MLGLEAPGRLAYSTTCGFSSTITLLASTLLEMLLILKRHGRHGFLLFLLQRYSWGYQQHQMPLGVASSLCLIWLQLCSQSLRALRIMGVLCSGPSTMTMKLVIALPLKAMSRLCSLCSITCESYKLVRDVLSLCMLYCESKHCCCLLSYVHIGLFHRYSVIAALF